MTNLKGYGTLFDMDGVLHDSEALHYKAHVDNFNEIQTYIKNRRHKEISDNQTFREPEISFDKTYYAKKRLGTPTRETVQIMFDSCGIKNPKQEEIRYFSNRKEQLVLSYGTSEIFDGVHEVFRDLKKANGSIAIVTSSPKDITYKFFSETGKFSQLREYVTGIVTADDIKNGKPDPEPYNKGREILEINNPLYCVGIEDSPAGIESIQNGNMSAIGFPSFFSKHLEGILNKEEIKKLEIEKFGYADTIIDDLREITPSLVKKIIENKK